MFGTWEESVTTLIAAAIALPIIRWLYWFLCEPLDMFRSFEEVGYSNVKGQRMRSKKDIINRMRKNRNLGRMPPPFPNGWYVLVESAQLPAGKAKYVQALGKHFAVFRGQTSGKAFVTDAYCPHLGANLAATPSTQVKGDCIECPFHKWKFDGNDGSCTEIPYSTKVPAFAKVKTHHSLEVNGFIFVWHHAEEIEPTWEPFQIPELEPSFGSDQWIYRGRTEYEVNAHIEDLPENGADAQHLQAIHIDSMFVGGDVSHWISNFFKWNWHEWNITWAQQPEEERKHIGVLELIHALRLGKYSVMQMKIIGEQIGPSLVHLNFNGCWGRGVMFQYILPIEPMLQKVVHVFYTNKKWIEPLAKISLWGEANMLERDIAIWGMKKYEDKPIIIKEDSLIAKHRRWYSQFYSEHSKSYAEACENGVDF